VSLEPVSERSLSADWAWISKVPGAGQDYGILSRSRGGIDVGAIAWDYVPGSPDPDDPPDAPWGPPWYTFGAHQIAGRALVSMSVVQGREGLDQAYRPIWPRVFFACEYADLAKHDASYTALCAAASGIDLSTVGDQPVRLDVASAASESRAGIAVAIEELGFPKLAAIAAALLEKRQVAVTGTKRMPAKERVLLLDCVAALLPYGCRASLTATTAIDSKIVPTVYLALTDFAGDGQLEAPLMAPSLPQPQPQDERAARYLDMLQERVKTSGLAAVVGHLWAAKRPCPLDPAAAVEVLRHLDRYGYASKRVEESPRARLEDALELLDGRQPDVRRRWNRDRDRDPSIPRKVLDTLLASDDPRAAVALRAHWFTVLNDLATLAGQELSAGRLEVVEHSLRVAGFAQGEEFADALLDSLLISPENTETWRAEIKPRVLLLGRLGRLDLPPTGRFPITCNNLRYGELAGWEAQLVQALLSAELASDETATRAVGWASWLGTTDFTAEWRRPVWVQALGFASTAVPESGDAASVRSVITARVRWALLVLRLARQAGRLAALVDTADLDLCVVELACLLGGQDSQQAEFRAPFADVLDTPLGDTGATAAAVAAVDVARVVLRTPPRDFPLARPAPEFDAYLAGLRRAFRALPAEQWRDYVQQRFLVHVVGGDGGRPRRLSDAAVLLLKDWIADPALAPELVRYISEQKLIGLLEADPLITSDFWLRLIRYEEFEELAPLVKMNEAARKAVDSPATEFSRGTKQTIDLATGEHVTSVVGGALGQAMYQYWRSGATQDQILAAIAREWRSAGTPARLTEVVPPVKLWVALREFQTLVAGHVPAEGEAARATSPGRPPDFRKQAEQAWAACLWLIVHGGALGGDYAKSFQKMVGQEAKLGEGDYRAVRHIFGPQPSLLRRLRPSAAARYGRWLGAPPPAVPERTASAPGADGRNDASSWPPSSANLGAVAEKGSGSLGYADSDHPSAHAARTSAGQHRRPRSGQQPISGDDQRLGEAPDDPRGASSR
jgi:hypothetical protein